MIQLSQENCQVEEVRRVKVENEPKETSERRQEKITPNFVFNAQLIECKMLSSSLLVSLKREFFNFHPHARQL